MTNIRNLFIASDWDGDINFNVKNDNGDFIYSGSYRNMPEPLEGMTVLHFVQKSCDYVEITVTKALENGVYYIGFHQNESPFSKFYVIAETHSKSIAKFITDHYNSFGDDIYHFYAADECKEFAGIEYLEG